MIYFNIRLVYTKLRFNMTGQIWYWLKSYHHHCVKMVKQWLYQRGWKKSVSHDQKRAISSILCPKNHCRHLTPWLLHHLNQLIVPSRMGCVLLWIQIQSESSVSLLLNLGAARQGRSVLLSDEQKLLLKGWKKGFVMITKLDFMRC